MKTKILILLLITATATATAQITPYIGVSIDPAMATFGPYHNKPNDIGATLNAEFRGGIEKELSYTSGLRFGMSYEIHPALNYTKLAWFQVDYRVRIVENLYGYAGLEISQIRRKNDNAWWGDPYNYRKVEKTKLNPGANIELQYMITKNLGLSTNINIFRAEQVLIDEGKNIRWDAMCGFVLKI